MHRKVFAVALLMLATVSLSMLYTAYSEDFDARIVEYVERIAELEAKHVDARNVVDKLNEAVKAFEQGDHARAGLILSEVDTMLADLEEGSQQAYLLHTASKAASVAVLALIPLLVYTLLPRAYIYLWFKTRRKWVVREY